MVISKVIAAFLLASLAGASATLKANEPPFVFEAKICLNYRDAQAGQCSEVTELPHDSSGKVEKISIYMEFLWRSTERPYIPTYMKWEFVKSSGSRTRVADYSTDDAFVIAPTRTTPTFPWVVAQRITLDRVGTYEFRAFLDRNDHDSSEVGRVSVRVGAIDRSAHDDSEVGEVSVRGGILDPDNHDDSEARRVPVQVENE